MDITSLILLLLFFYIPFNTLCSFGNHFHYFRGLCNSLPGAREDPFKGELFYFCATEQIIITVILIITIIHFQTLQTNIKLGHNTVVKPIFFLLLTHSDQK